MEGRRSIINSCNYNLTGRVVIPEDPLYDVARQGYNRAIQNYPLIIVYCGSSYDVSNAVMWARAHGVALRIRNGGHNYEGYSNGNCALVIDISEMTGMEIDEQENLIQVQGGVTNGEVYQFAAAYGYPFPGGTCPTVGLCGYTTGGGWGLSCRLLGLGCDSLEEFELVNYEGCILKASKTCNSGLFWACRGAGGGNFGVIVSMKFKLPPKVDLVTLIEIDYLHVTAVQQEAFLEVWQNWLTDADTRVTLISRIYNSQEDGLAMLVRGIFYGTAQEAQLIMQPFLLLPGAESSFLYTSFLEAVTILGSSYPPYEKFQSVSRYAMRKWAPSEIAQLAALIRLPAEGAVFSGLSLYALGGKVGEVHQDETAFFYRNAHFIVWLETVWEDTEFQEENQNWIQQRLPALFAVTEGSYINFPYDNLPDYLAEYYGTHDFRLREVKKQYDPCNIFTFPQGIWGAAQLMRYPNTAMRTETPAVQSGTGYYRGFRYVQRSLGDADL